MLAIPMALDLVATILLSVGVSSLLAPTLSDLNAGTAPENCLRFDT